MDTNHFSNKLKKKKKKEKRKREEGIRTHVLADEGHVLILIRKHFLTFLIMKTLN